MAGQLDLIENIIEEKLLHLHTAFLGKIIKVNDYDTGYITYNIQPLTLTKQYGREPKFQAVLYDIRAIDGIGKIKTGTTVLCTVCERDISDAIKGLSSLPAYGRHEMKDSVIIGTIGRVYDD